MSPREFGRTVADLRAFLNRADYVQIAVRTGLDRYTYVSTGAAELRAHLRSFDAAHPMPCEFAPQLGYLAIGTFDAIRQADGGTS